MTKAPGGLDEWHRGGSLRSDSIFGQTRPPRLQGITRRGFGRLVAGATATTFFRPIVTHAAAGLARIVIVGGGVGGATAAVFLKRRAPELDITLLEPNETYTSCYFSNSYLGGLKDIGPLTHGYAGLRQLGVKLLTRAATEIDPVRRIVRAGDSTELRYDRLILSPGIGIRYDAIEGYGPGAAQIMPHAYTADIQQKLLLRHQLEAMEDGGTVLMTTPPFPYRCPPAPYERACMIAYYLKTRKPKAKLVILDPKRSFPLQSLFVDAFERYYKGLVELNMSSEFDDFTPVRVDAATRTIKVRSGAVFTGHVVNIIPPQRAGDIALRSGFGGGDWCPVHPETFASVKTQDVYIIGDSSIAPPMPKSAYLANAQAKLVASEILADLGKGQRLAARLGNNCWSLVAPRDLIKTGATFAPVAGKMVESGSYSSKIDEGADVRRMNLRESEAWYADVSADMFPA